jgi:ribonuclease VapC
MVIDTSAIMAILLFEAEARSFADAIMTAAARRVSTGTLLELEIVANVRRGRIGLPDVDDFLEKAQIEIVPFDREQARFARGAYRRYGRGNHRAGLNFGDCFAYALAKATGEPLLFKGADFAHTDVVSAL